MSRLLSQVFLRIAVIKTPCQWTASLWAWSFSVLISRASDTLTFTATSDGSASTSGFQIITPHLNLTIFTVQAIMLQKDSGQEKPLIF